MIRIPSFINVETPLKPKNLAFFKQALRSLIKIIIYSFFSVLPLNNFEDVS